jgi:hypothetical protein
MDLGSVFLQEEFFCHFCHSALDDSQIKLAVSVALLERRARVSVREFQRNDAFKREILDSFLRG